MVRSCDSRAAQYSCSVSMGGTPSSSETSAHEAVCEVTNMIVGNAVTQLNDRGFRFKVSPPDVYSSTDALHSTANTEALILRFETPFGNVLLNIAMHYGVRNASHAPALTTI